MKLSDKIIKLRKQHGLSQEILAEKLNISRQSLSRWENGTSLPDANNILQISKLFNVTTDYLLNDDYESDDDLPKIKKVKEDNNQQIIFIFTTLEVMFVILQFMCVSILKNIFFSILSFIPFCALIGGFEYAIYKNKTDKNENIIHFRKKFYKISAWLGLYFPIRLLVLSFVNIYPHSYSKVALECVIIILYIGTSLITNLNIEKSYSFE